MYFLLHIFIIVLHFNHDFLVDKLPEEATASAEGACQRALAPALHWCCAPQPQPIVEAGHYATGASFERPGPDPKNPHGSTGKLCLELSLAGDCVGKSTLIVPIVEGTGLQEFPIRTSQSRHAPMLGIQSGIGINRRDKQIVVGHRKEDRTNNGPEVQVPGCEPREKRRGKGKGQSEQASPFAQTSPWPTSETTYAFPSPFTSQAPVAPTTQLGATDTDDVELILAVKEQYPDISKAPSKNTIGGSQSREEEGEAVANRLAKTSKEVGIAGKELQALREAQSKHRERWIKHLQESVQSWEQQLKLYTEQQANYNNLIKKATQELNTARQTLEVLNKKSRWKRRDRRSRCRCRRSENGRRRSPGIGAAGADDPAILRQSRRQGGDDGNLRLRGGCATWTAGKAPALSRAIFWTAWSYLFCIVNVGSDPSCLLGKNEFRGPTIASPLMTEEALGGSFTCPLTACHSAIWDPALPFQDTFAALGRALLLQGEVILASSPEPSQTLPWSSVWSWPRPRPSKRVRSIARSNKPNTQVRFHDQVDCISGTGFLTTEPIREVCNDEDVLDIVTLMARAPRRHDVSGSSADENLDSDVETHTPTSPASYGGERMWRSVQIYDMRANHARGSNTGPSTGSLLC